MPERRTHTSTTCFSFSIFQPYGHPRDLHSFPTRRSSDLWNAAAKLIADQAKAVGIEIKNVTVGEDNYYTLRTDGKYDYQLMFCGMVGGPTPYYLYNQYLNRAQIGQGKFNFVAWNAPASEQFLKDN